MSVKPIIPSIESNSNAKKVRQNQIQQRQQKNVSFQGGENLIVVIQDAIDRGGFAGTFVLQDFLGMAAPRVGAGILRNHDKTGHYNWDFARREGVREVLSGPSAFLIPMAMLPFIKKFSGSANNVPVDFINRFSDTFSEFTKNNKDMIAQPEVRGKLYKEMFKDILSSSTNNGLQGEELDKMAESYSNRLLEIFNKKQSPNKSVWYSLRGKSQPNSKQDKVSALLNEFVELRKKYVGLDVDATQAVYTTPNGTASGSLKHVLNHMRDYVDDALKSTSNALKKAKDFDAEEFIKTFSRRRTGSRFLSNMAMFGAVVGFYNLIPKLYNLGVKGGRDPGLDGLDAESSKKHTNNPSFGQPEKVETPDNSGAVNNSAQQKDSTDKKTDPSFTGAPQKAMAALGDKINKGGFLKSVISDNFEFHGASMTPKAMLTLLFGFCLPPRLKNAKSEYEYKEIIVRDITSFAAILFAGKALGRVFSKLLSKYSGLVLSINPEKHSGLWNKFKHYFSPTSAGINVLDSPQIVSKYSDLRIAKDGFNDFIHFICKNGGNIRKVLMLDKNVASSAEKIVGKPIKSSSVMEIVNAFKNAEKTHPTEMEAIYKAFDSKDNEFVTRAKSYNSSFNLISNLVLVPILMISLAKHCEHMTAKRVAEEKKRKQVTTPQMQVAMVPSNKPTMAGFLGK